MLPYEDGKWIQKSTLKSLKKKRQLLKAYLGSLPVNILDSLLLNLLYQMSIELTFENFNKGCSFCSS